MTVLRHTVKPQSFTEHSSAARNLHLDGEAWINSSQSWAQIQLSKLPYLFVVLLLMPACFTENVPSTVKVGYDVTAFSGTPAGLHSWYKGCVQMIKTFTGSSTLVSCRRKAKPQQKCLRYMSKAEALRKQSLTARSQWSFVTLCCEMPVQQLSCVSVLYLYIYIFKFHACREIIRLLGMIRQGAGRYKGCLYFISPDPICS